MLSVKSKESITTKGELTSHAHGPNTAPLDYFFKDSLHIKIIFIFFEVVKKRVCGEKIQP